MDSREHALYYLKKGYQPIPLPKGHKGPVMKEWQKSRFTCEEISDIFERDCNVGLLLGEPFGWLVDVDLDCSEALSSAPAILPDTPMKSGRKSKPKSHYFYISEHAKTQQYSDPEDGSTLVEIRSTGAQTIVQPSVHPSGERITWCCKKLQPSKVDHESLQRKVAILAVCCLIGKRWNKGSRNDPIVLRKIPPFVLR